MTMFNLTSFFNDKENKYLAIGLVAAGIIAGGWYGYAWYKKNLEQKAQKDFSAAVQDYYKMLGSGAKASSWEDFEKGLAIFADKHSSSVLAPYFLAYQADAYINQGKVKEGLDTLDKALSKMQKDLPVYYMYATKKALIKLDSSDVAMRQEGLKELDALSQDKENPTQDMALFYLGNNALRMGNDSEAEKFWKQLINCAGSKSVWTQRAKEMLQDGI